MSIERKKKKMGALEEKGQNMAIVAPLIQHHPEKKWHEYGDVERADKLNSNLDYIRTVEEQAEHLLKRDVELHGQMQSVKNATEAAWLNTVLVRGTAGDKVTALQVLVQRSPVHSLAHIAALVATAGKKNREAFSLLGLLKDLFINDLLPAKRKLILFSARPLDAVNLPSLNKDCNLKRKLILWKFESELKALYEKFVTTIERLAGGNVEKLCIMACRCAFELLLQRPEQEQKLLSLLVNKLGNPNRALATRVCGYLLQLTKKQRLMRFVVVKEVERLIFRKNITCSAQLHALSFLSQMDLYECDPKLAVTLLNIYIGLFRMLVLNEKMDNKMLNVLLLATNRAFPYAKGETEMLTKEVDTLYKILHQANFSTALQTLKLLYQLLTMSEGISDRFYSALYRRILDCQHSTNLDGQLFALLYKALSSDLVEGRVIAFIKRLLQLSLCRSANFAAASLILVSRLLEENPSLLITKKAANVFLREKFNEIVKSEVASDDDEMYEDYDLSTDKNPSTSASKKDEMPNEDKKLNQNQIAGWVHKNNIVMRNGATKYDPMVRNPLFARADESIATELALLSMHYHPSVAVFASDLIEGTVIRYDGDPLLDFTQMRFLDRFVFRNPKTKDSKDSNVVRRKVYNPHGVRKLPVTSKEYASKDRSEIPADEKFLHRFASLKMHRELERRMNKGDVHVQEEDDDNEDVESVNSDEFDMLLRQFEPGEKREVFDVDFSQEFGLEKKKEVINRKRRNDFDEEEDESEEEGEIDVDDEEELDNWSEEEKDDNDEIDLEDEDEVSSENESFMRTKSNGDNIDSDDDLAEQLDFAEDAALSADKFAAMLEEEEESQRIKSKKKVRKPRGYKKRRTR